MQKLQCELCGSVDIVRTDDGFFQCQHCGCKYTLAQAKALLGTVETTIGTAELERLLKNAKTFLDIGKFEDAEKVYTDITKQFPDDYRGWLGLLWVAYRRHPDYKFYGLSFNEMLERHKICQKLAPSHKERAEVDREWAEYWDTGAALFRSGKLCIESYPENGYEETTPAMYNYMKSGFENAKILNELNAFYSSKDNQWILRTPTTYKYDFWLGKALYLDVPYDSDSYSNPKRVSEIVLPPLDEAYIAKIKSDLQKYYAEMLSHKKCPYCRVYFQMFSKKCPECGRKF